jgi:hypothetical protein
MRSTAPLINLVNESRLERGMQTYDQYAVSCFEAMREKCRALEIAAAAEFERTPIWRPVRMFRAYIELAAWRRARAVCHVATTMV